MFEQIYMNFVINPHIPNLTHGYNAYANDNGWYGSAA